MFQFGSKQILLNPQSFEKNFLFFTFEPNLATRYPEEDLQKFRNSTLPSRQKKTYQRYSHESNFSYKKKVKK